MNLSSFKKILAEQSEINFILPSGEQVPPHFHVTEVGQIDKKFIDCGGTIRNEQVVNFQLWKSEDYDHRLAPQKLIAIIELSERKLGIGDHEIEVEYQGSTIGKYALGHDGRNFLLLSTATDCLAKDNCGIPVEKKRVSLAELSTPANSCCSPDSGCC